ncbi:MAG: anthranilate synthase component I family protein [Lewinellaceae bacterium]|nr:anthranilate synthase component I family protein [Lewinellaceae bacterium]
MTASFPLASVVGFKLKLFAWAKQFEIGCYLDHNAYQGYYCHDYECLVAVGLDDEIIHEEKGAFDALKNFVDEKKDWYFGYLTYDLKNDVELLSSANFDGIQFPALHFFRPLYVFEVFDHEVVIHSKNEDPARLFHSINALPIELAKHSLLQKVILSPRICEADYLDSVSSIRQHIHRGDIYEMNFCQEFFAENTPLDAAVVFQKLNVFSKAPFSAFYKLNDKFLLCASPERFIKKTGSKLISQPIKGTIRRGGNVSEDAILGQQLFNRPKDRSENVMIVDLVRNDLARSCRAGTVNVEELFGIYRFEQVIQMISTVSGELKSDVHFMDAIRSAFPMGSMTGAPKVRSMQLIEQFEQTKRGLYSGAVGYITPAQDFDFNVVIRSILYNQASGYLSVQVGGAIVYDSEPALEFEECLLKAKGMFKVLS